MLEDVTEEQIAFATLRLLSGCQYAYRADIRGGVIVAMEREHVQVYSTYTADGVTRNTNQFSSSDIDGFITRTVDRIIEASRFLQIGMVSSDVRQMRTP